MPEKNQQKPRIIHPLTCSPYSSHSEVESFG